MASIIRISSLIVTLALIQGCATNIDPATDDVPAEDVMVTQDTVEEAAQLASDQEHAAGDSPAQAAVVALLDLSVQEQQSGRTGLAIAAVERALRMDPKNPMLWTQLANLRLAQGNWQQAGVLANKSISLSRDNVALRLENWRIIELAKTRQGDAAAAEQARARIRALSNQP